MQSGKLGKLGKRGKLGKPGKPGKLGKRGKPGKLGKRGKLGKPGKRGKLGKPGKLGKLGKPGKPGKLGKRGKRGKLGKRGFMTSKAQRAITKLILARPWWASLLLHLRLVESKMVPTAAVDGVSLYYNPSFTDRLSAAELEGVLCHEVAHCALLHITRCGSRDPERWNIAADAVVNAMLLADGITLPPDHVPACALGLTVEEVYADLKKKGHKSLAEHLRDLLAPAAHAADSKAITSTQIERHWQRAVAAAAGLAPGVLKRQIDDAQNARLPWKTLLVQFIQSYVKSADRSWCRTSRRFPGMLPGWKRQPETSIAIIVDTSGSISGALLMAFMAECRACLNTEGVSAYLIAADAAVGLTVEPGSPWPAVLPGGGGTDFCPALTLCESLDTVDAVIYFTDGQGRFPSGSTKPVLWVLSERNFVAPFGTSIYLEDEPA